MIDLAAEVAKQAAEARAEAAACDAQLPDVDALARGGALMAKRVPDELLAKLARSRIDGSLERGLRARLGDGAVLSAIVHVVAALLAEQAEDAGERLLGLTDAARKKSATLAGRADALRDQAGRLEQTLLACSATADPETAANPSAARGSREATPPTEQPTHTEEAQQ